jgi:hypothetical protein
MEENEIGGGRIMATYIHANGDTIQTLEKGKFVVTRNGVEQHFDVSHWGFVG